MAPREHGAWANLGFPLLTGLTAATPTLAGAVWAGAAVVLFLAHEPLLVVLGQRGGRVQRRDGVAARRRLVGRLAVGLGLAAAFAVVAPAQARLVALVPIGGALALLPFTLRGKEKTAVGEIVAGFAFAANALPVLAAAGRPDLGWLAAGVWFVGFTHATVAVRAVIAQHRAPRMVPGRLLAPLVASLGIALGLAAVSRDLAHPLVVAALVVPTVLTIVVCVRPPPPKKLRTVGLSLAASFGLCFLLLLVGLLLAPGAG